MFNKPLFKFLCVGLVGAVGGIGMFVGVMVFVLPSLAQIVPEPRVNLASIGCPRGTVEDMNLKRCVINQQSETALAYAMESAGLGNAAGGIPAPVVFRRVANRANISEAKKFQWLFAAALLGDPESQFLVGAMYSKGTGTKEDDREALKWLKESAQNGYRKAQLRLAYMLSKGEYVRKDDQAASLWMKEAKRLSRVEPRKAARNHSLMLPRQHKLYQRVRPK